MRRSVAVFLLFLLALAVLPVALPGQAQSNPAVYVTSQYTLNRYGFATINETVAFLNSGSSAAQGPDITFGFGNLTSKVVAYNLTGSTFVSTPGSPAGPFSVAGTSVDPGKNSTYVLSLLLNGVVSAEKNGSLEVLTLSTPTLSYNVTRLINLVQMPTSTTFQSVPLQLKASITGSNNTYYMISKNAMPQAAVTSVRAIAFSTAQDFNPLKVFSAQRVISVGTNGNPMVTDTIEFQNQGNNTLSGLYVSPLTSPSASVTILVQPEPRLLGSISLPLTSDAIDLSAIAVGYPTTGISAGGNYTVSFQYPLQQKYYSVSGAQVTVNIPESAPIPAFVDSYSISVSTPVGVRVVQGTPVTLTNLTPWSQGKTTLSYAITSGWGLQSVVPGASVVFILLLLGLFVSRVQLSEEEETEEASTGDLASGMINAFEEKTNLINGLWTEITSKDPNEIGKEYFDELRGRLDAFRSRAVQRLNELRQRSTSQRFSDLLNQIQSTEREVDRAAKDKLNLYDQYYLNRMRKDVYERLLPQYTRRLEKALNQLSDELHLVQREAKVQ